MHEPWTQADDDNLADLYWYIQGWLDHADVEAERAPLDRRHADSLRRARVHLYDRMEDKGDGKD
jgi:hypothetical protein